MSDDVLQLSSLSFQGWYIVTYALAIYHLNLLLAFLTPKIDPALAEFEAEEGKLILLTNTNLPAHAFLAMSLFISLYS